MTDINRRIAGFGWWIVFVSCVVAANWAIKRYGLVSVGFGYTAPAGVYFAGLALTARDQVRERWGFIAALTAVFVGALIAWVVEDVGRIALASGVAFAVSETTDALVYEPMRRRWATAVVVSGVAGLVVDSMLFLMIAFGSLAFIEGQLVGKTVVTLVAVGLLAVVREWRR